MSNTAFTEMPKHQTAITALFHLGMDTLATIGIGRLEIFFFVDLEILICHCWGSIRKHHLLLVLFVLFI